ncbi:MAG: SMI1/KNR4 family protein [Lachnospiraceae bacterium]
MDIIKFLRKICNTPDCIVYSPCGLPSIGKGKELPYDLKVFYENCGGISLFASKEYGFTIVNPKEMVLANPVIVGELCEEDISSAWYIICKDAENNYITIDMAKERLGRCYDSFWDRHGVVGECAIIARTFTELVTQLYNNQGDNLYWLNDGFVNIGDAYDEIQ